MGYIPSQQTKQLDLGQLNALYEGSWVQVITVLSRSQKREIDRRVAGLVSLDIGADGKASVGASAGMAASMTDMADLMVLMAVCDWNLTDAGGTPLPLQPDDARQASIDQLPEDVFDLIFNTANKAVKPRTDVERATFRGDSVAVAPDGNGSPGSLPVAVAVLDEGGAVVPAGPPS